MGRSHSRDLAALPPFGRLKAIEPTDNRASNQAVIWECRCSCGKVAFVATHNLTSGNTRSCGCLQRERSRENRKLAAPTIKAPLRPGPAKRGTTAMRWFVTASAIEDYMELCGDDIDDGPAFHRAAARLRALARRATFKRTYAGGRFESWRVNAPIRGRTVRLDLAVSQAVREGYADQLVHVKDTDARRKTPTELATGKVTGDTETVPAVSPRSQTRPN